MSSDTGSQVPVVLVADDEEDILDLVVLCLEEEGYDVLTAPDGGRALKLATEHKPDLCIFDVMMPRMDGVSLTKAVREVPELADVPILLLTAKTQRESVEKARAAGADEYITKPFIPDDLQRSVRSMLREAPTIPDSIEIEPVAPSAEGGAPSHLPRAAAPEANGDSGSGAGHVLVAAGDRNVMQLVSYCLGLSGYRVLEASDGSSAAKLALDKRPVLCVLDEALPGSDGAATTEAIRRGDGGDAIPILVLAEREGEGRIRAEAAGANGVVDKPFGAPQLYEAVREVLAGVTQSAAQTG